MTSFIPWPVWPSAWSVSKKYLHVNTIWTADTIPPAMNYEVSEVSKIEGTQIKRWNKVGVTEIYAWCKEKWQEICIDACWEADTFCPYLENRHDDQEHNLKRHPNCNRTAHAPEISYVWWNNSRFNKLSHCTRICLHANKGETCFKKIKSINNKIIMSSAVFRNTLGCFSSFWLSFQVMF